MMDYSQFCAEGATCSNGYIKGAKGVELFQIHFQPSSPSKFPPVIFLAGWGSLINSWEIVLKDMTKDFEIIYLETREKGSAIHLQKMALSVEALGTDLGPILHHHKLSPGQYIMFGSSLGATVILDAMSRNKIDPSGAVLVGPNGEFKPPWWGGPLIYFINTLSYWAVKPLVKWVMRKRYLDTEADPGQYHKYARSLDAANPGRLRQSALQFYKYKIWDRLSKIHQNVLIFTGSKDVLHGYENTVKIAELLSNCDLVDLETNAWTHSVEMVNHMRSYLKEVNLV